MPQSTQRIPGFDWLRVLALGLVVVFHILVLLGLRDYTKIAHVSLGSLGVTLFLGISGALIARDRRPPTDWLLARFTKIYPAYWMATFLAFGAAAVSGYKQVSILQFCWQLSGLGLYFLEDLINVATWFIGLLVALYLSVFLARMASRPHAPIQLLAIAATVLVLFDCDAGYFAYCLVFYGALLAFMTEWPAKSLLVLAAPCFVLSGLRYEFLSVSLVWVLLAVSLSIQTLPAVASWIAKYSYEFYLVHGIFLVGSLRVFRAEGVGYRSLIAMLIGLSITTLAAMVIQKLSQGIFKR